jgi:meso-butanediol dehydrogenase/(S,S)-butanediol dehydrogenase/diacetyl reductase
MMDFSGKVAIVTGAASGIGEATARQFSQHGATVVLVDRDGRKLRRVAASLPAERTRQRALDVADRTAVRRMIADAASRLGRIDVLHNNAGIYFEADAAGTSAEAWQRIFDVDVSAVLFASQAALPHLKKTRGCIVNTSSMAGLGGDRGQVAYNTMKGALSNLTRAMAIDHARDGIRVNAVCPSFTRTGMTVDDEKDPALVRAFLDRMPMGRLGEPDDVAKVVLFLASDYAGFVTGVNLPVDGGLSASNGHPLFELD